MAPSWVLKRPKLEGFFVGIGIARREGNLAESRDRALKHALNNIATQIETRVFSNVQMEDTEKAGEIRQEYRAEIKTMVSTTLEGVEIVDTWEDTENCWVYARLSIATFERLRQEKIENARRSAFSYFSKAEETGQEAIAEALSLYLQALKPLHDALGDPLHVMHRGKSISLDTEIPLRIQDLLSSIELEASPVATPLKQGVSIDVPLRVAAYFKDEKGTSHTVSGLPIQFAFEKGSGDLVDRIWSGDSGVASSSLMKIRDPASAQIVQAKIDLASFFTQDPHGLAVQKQLVRFAAPSVIFRLNVRRRMVYITSEESNLGNSLRPLYIEPVVKEKLGDLGLDFVDQPGQADLIIEISARTRQGNRFRDIYFAFLDMTLSVRSPDRDDEVFKTPLSNIKGAGASYEQAGIKAFEKAGEQLKKTVLPDMLDALNR